jgi:hypothetical protein
LNLELSDTTIGFGSGSQGHILFAEFALMPIPTILIEVTSIRFGKLDEFFDLSGEYDAKRVLRCLGRLREPRSRARTRHICGGTPSPFNSVTSTSALCSCKPLIC